MVHSSAGCSVGEGSELVRGGPVDLRQEWHLHLELQRVMLGIEPVARPLLSSTDARCRVLTAGAMTSSRGVAHPLCRPRAHDRQAIPDNHVDDGANIEQIDRDPLLPFLQARARSCHALISILTSAKRQVRLGAIRTRAALFASFRVSAAQRVSASPSVTWSAVRAARPASVQIVSRTQQRRLKALAPR